jgi:hypothetical protein
MRDGGFFKSKAANGSQFWKILHTLKHLFKWGTVHRIGNEENTQFWNDVWLASSPLRLGFPRLFGICNETHMSVAEGARMDWHLSWRRMMGEEERKEWTDLQALLDVVELTEEEDEVCWGLTTSKTFTTSSMYKFLTSGGVSCKMPDKIWKCKVPLKIRIFI